MVNEAEQECHRECGKAVNYGMNTHAPSLYIACKFPTRFDTITAFIQRSGVIT